MKIKQGTAYYLHDFTKTLLIFYSIIVSLVLLTLLLNSIFVGHASFGGLELSASISLFVFGLNAFKPNLRMFLQSGTSRRTLWCSFCIAAVGVALSVGLINSLFPVVFRQTVGYESTFDLLYLTYASSIQGYSLLRTLWCSMGYMSFLFLGFFLSTLYYRMNTLLKVIVSVGVPALVFVVMPIAEVYFSWFHGFTSLLRFTSWAMGLILTEGKSIPWRGVGSMAVFSAVMAGLSFLLIRRAPLKDV